MQIEINDKALEGKLERIARQDGVPVEQVAIDLINSALDDDAAAIRACRHKIFSHKTTHRI